MGKIKITSSTNDTYKVGDTIDMMAFLSDYFRNCIDRDYVAYLQRIPMPSAVEIIAEELGIEYEFV